MKRYNKINGLELGLGYRVAGIAYLLWGKRDKSYKLTHRLSLVTPYDFA